MFCPVCSAEYPENVEVCPRCHADLVEELPAEGDPQAHDTFLLLWAGMDPGVHADLSAALERDGIAGRTIHREDYFIDADLHHPFELYVPSQSWARAEEILQQVLGVGEEEAAALSAGVLALPADDGAEDAGHHRGSRADWREDDATVEIWSGDDPGVADMIGVCLRENQIRYRRGPLPEAEDAPEEPDEAAPETLMVAPEDEARAREIIREIVDAAPGESAESVAESELEQ